MTDIDLGDGIQARFLSTDQHRGVLVLSGPGLSDAISDTDPGDIGMTANLKTCRPLKPEAEFTAAQDQSFYQRSASTPCRAIRSTLARVGRGKPAASGIITRGAGSYFKIENLLHQRGISAAVVSGCNTVHGLGRMFGFNVIEDARFTADLDTDLDAKIAKAGSLLRES